MGRDKALLEVDGVAMALRVANALTAAGASEAVAIGGNASRLEELGLDVVADRWPSEGPLSGILSALAWSSAPVTVVLACDLREPTPDAITRTVEALERGPGRVAVPLLDGLPQWMHAAWRTSAMEDLHARFIAGERAVHRAVHRAVQSTEIIAVHHIPAIQLEDADRVSDL
jgi:molybdopterin-guanine dinucleotide biosynthesis protein A